MRLLSLPLLFRLLIVILICILGPGGSHASASASAGQDVPPVVNFPISPGAVECTVEPRAPEALVALLGTPVAGGEPAVEPSPVAVPVGQRADEETRESVIAAVSELTACFNVGDSLRAFALATDAFLQAYVEENDLTAEDIAMLLLPASEPTVAEAQSTILAVSNIAELADGRTGAFVVTTSEWRGPATSYMIFVQDGDRWLLDEVIDFP